MVEAGISKDGQCAHGGEHDKDPEEHAVYHHGNVLPVLLQLAGDGWMKRKGKMDRWGERRRNGRGAEGGEEGVAAGGRTGNARQKEGKENRVQEQAEEQEPEQETAFYKGIQESEDKRRTSIQTKTDR